MNRRGFLSTLAGAIAARFAPKPEPTTLLDAFAEGFENLKQYIAPQVDRSVIGLGFYRIVVDGCPINHAEDRRLPPGFVHVND